MSKNKIEKKIHFKEYREVDKIIRYLTSSDQTIDLTVREKKKLDMIRIVHGLRTNYNSKKEIREILINMHNVGERQAYNLITETEEVLGKAEQVSQLYLRNWLIDKAMKGIEMAEKTRNSLAFSKALSEFRKAAGLDIYIPDMPDFSALEPHLYKIQLPNNVISYLKDSLNKGVLKMSDIIPVPNINLDTIEEAKQE